jgi:flagellar assembly protein FliH
MTSSSKPPQKNVPPPGGAKPASVHARFIPREEVQSFHAWNPGSFGGRPEAAAKAPEGPSIEEIRNKMLAARQGGYQDGYRDGLSALDGFKQSYAAQLTMQIGTLLKSFDTQLNGLEVQMAEALAHAATQLARQVVRGELVTRPELVATVAREALSSLLRSAKHVTLLVHPDDIPLVAQGAADEIEHRGARLMASMTVSRGGVQIESDVGAIDGTIETRWHRAASALGDGSPLGDAHPDVGDLVLRDGADQ